MYLFARRPFAPLASEAVAERDARIAEVGAPVVSEGWGEEEEEMMVVAVEAVP